MLCIAGRENVVSRSSFSYSHISSKEEYAYHLGQKKVSYETGRFKGKGNGRRGEGTGTAFLWFL